MWLRDRTRGMSGRYKAFISSDGMEILVGNKDQDNDYLTFKVASAQDFWLHVADNSGAHVIVRNHKKLKKLPKNTSPSSVNSRLSQQKPAVELPKKRKKCTLHTLNVWRKRG